VDQASSDLMEIVAKKGRNLPRAKSRENKTHGPCDRARYITKLFRG